MKVTPVLLALSLAANLALGAFAYSRWSSPPTTSVAAIYTPLPAAPRLPVIVPTPPNARFVAPADNASYVAQLRADGFPPDVIRALVQMRVSRRYQDMKKALRGPIPDEYWKAVDFSNFPGGPTTPEMRAAFRQLDRDMADELRALLGTGNDALSPYERSRRERTMGHLSSEKINQVEALQRDYADLRRQVTESSNGLILKTDREQLRLLEREQRADLAAVLTPDELREYDLRASPSADATRSKLRFFDATEDEYRALATLQLEFDQTYGVTNLSQDEQTRRRTAEPQLLEKIKAQLGPERFATYLVTTDGVFSETRAFTRSYGYDDAMARQLVATKQDFSRRADAVLNDSSLSREARTAALTALNTEASTQLGATLGADNFAKYRRSAGNWMNKLGKPSTP
ncbi:MAG: hypothetical protein HZA32_07135 [Opitutae bacterium]|nr:hypothetical protein [Opitutae bacterium]